MSGDPDQEVSVRNWQRRHRVDGRALRAFVVEVVGALEIPHASVTLALVGDARMRKMNREFRGFDKATDVLSFPAGDDSGAGRYLGDIVISVDTAERQSRRRGSLLTRELRVLALHGVLHLLGYDHQTDDGEMRRVEYRLRRRFEITTPRRLTA